MKLPKPPPALALLLLSPAIGELLSGSAPPADFFNPFGFAILVSLYGSGAVIVRELTVRWKKGIGSVLLLGAAYGVLEEGLMVCSFFNPDWPDLGQLAVYGRWLGVNWVWAVMLTIYHAVYSITIPIVLVELAYPERCRESWAGNRMLKTVFVLLVSVVVLGFVLFASISSYWPPLPQYLPTVLAMILIGYAAYKLPAEWGSRGKKPLSRLSLMWTIGAVGTFVFFFGFWLIPALIPLWPIGMLFGPSLVLLYTKLLRSYDWKEPSEKHRFALVSGALTFFIVFAPLQELDATRTDNPVGMGFVGLAFLVGLVLLGRHIWRARSCGYRFSNSKVQVNVFKQSLILSDSTHNLGDLNFVNVGVDKIGFQDSAFTVGEDVGSHNFPIVRKTINKLLPNARATPKVVTSLM